MINLDYPLLLDLFKEHLDPKRTESASFLIWYLQNYYRLDSQEAVDSVCDQGGDKGIDGIYVNDNDSTIDIFQCKISQKANATIGDSHLREFAGSLSQFLDKSAIQNIVDTAGQAEIASLIKRVELINKIETYTVRGFFISNVDIDANGLAFLNGVANIKFIGRKDLEATYISDERNLPVATPATFDVSGFQISEYIVDKDTRCIIAPLKAKELVSLQGINNQAIFAFNVRGPLGNTKVNRDIARSIQDSAKHKLFPLIHNGITVICEKLSNTPDKITIERYFVVNGCQSLNSLFENSRSLTDDLRILTKVVQTKVESVLTKDITIASNNQNGVKPRDFMSNNAIQIRVQNEFNTLYTGLYCYEIKRGEQHCGGSIITNEDAGLYFMSFDLKEPWITHRKYQIFDEKYIELFARPEVTADRVLMCYLIMNVINAQTANITNKLFGKYALTKFGLLYIIRSILEKDPKGIELLREPHKFVRDQSNRAKFIKCIDKIVADVIIDVNGEVEQLGVEFDYRGKLRDQGWVKKLSQDIVASYLKLVQRKRINSFEIEWNAA